MSSMEIPPPREDYISNHRKIKLKSFFQAWKRAYEQSTPQPISKGIAVYAAFKWVELTLDNRRRMPTDVYRFPRYIAKEKDGKDSEYFLSRLRDYVCRNMQVSIERMPYFVHSVALLDAFQMSRIFNQWKWFHRQLQQMKRRQLRHRLRYYFVQWRIFNLQNEMLEDARIAVTLSRERKILKSTFRNWRVQMKAFMRQRVCVVPYHRRHAFHIWRALVQSRRWQRLSKARGQHYFPRRVVRLLLARWLEHLCRLSQAKKVSSSGEMRSWLLQMVKMQYFKQDTYFSRVLWRTVANRSKFFVKHPLILRLLHDFAFRSNVFDDGSQYEEKESIQHRRMQSNSALKRVLQVVRARLSSKISQQFLISCADQYYRFRTLLTVTRKWMLRVAQRMLDHSGHDEIDSYPLEPLSSQAGSHSQRIKSPSPVRIRSNIARFERESIQRPLHIADLSPIHPTTSYNLQYIRQSTIKSPILSQQPISFSSSSLHLGNCSKIKIHYYIRIWRQRARRLHDLKNCALWIQEQHHQREVATVFGAWLVLTARHQHVARMANRVLNHRLQRELYCAFFAWRHVFERAQLIHRNERQLLRIRSQEIQEFSHLYQQKVSSKAQGTVLKVWALFVRDRRRGKILYQLWEKLQYRLYPYQGHPLGRVFHQWKEVYHAGIIVTCFQRWWRGFRCRFLQHTALYQHLQWYKRRVPSMCALRRKHLLRQGWFVFRVHHALHRQRVQMTYQDHQKKRIFRRWWQHRRRWQRNNQVYAQCTRHFWRQRQRQALYFLLRYMHRRRFVHRLLRNSNRVQAKFALAQLRYCTSQHSRTRQITHRARAKRFVHLWHRWRRHSISSHLQESATNVSKQSLLRPQFVRWLRWSRYQRLLRHTSEVLMPWRKAQMLFRRWRQRAQYNQSRRHRSLRHNDFRAVQRAFHLLLRRLLGEEFFKTGRATWQQQQRQRKRRQRRLAYHQQFQQYHGTFNDPSVPRSLQHARQQRLTERSSSSRPRDDEYLSLDIRGHMQSRLYRGRVSGVSRGMLWRWRRWALRKRQYRAHVQQKMVVMKRRKKALFFRYLLQLWRENNPHSIPGENGPFASRRKKKKVQSAGLSHIQKKRFLQQRVLNSQIQNGSSKTRYMVMQPQHRPRDKQQQRLAWKSYVKRATQKRKQLGAFGDLGDNLQSATNLAGYHAPRIEFLCELYGYFHRWIFFRQRRQRVQLLIKEVHTGYWKHHQQDAWKQWAVTFTKRMRLEAKRSSLAEQYFVKQRLRKAFRMLWTLRNRQRHSRKLLLYYTTVRKPFRKIFHAMQRLKRKRRIYHTTVTLKFKKIVQKYRRRMFHFLERLKLLVYHRKYAKPAIIVQTKEKYRLQLQFRKLRTLCARYPIRRRLKLLVMHRYRQQKMRKSLRYWFHWSRLKVALHRVARRFAMIPCYKHWLARTFEVLQARRVVSVMQQKQKMRIFKQIMHAWRLRAIYQQRIALQALVVQQRRERKWKKWYFLQWIQTLDQHILYQRFLTISAKHQIRLKQRFLKTWVHRAKENERITFQNLLFGWRHWRHFVQRRRFYHHQQYQRAKVYDLWLRSIRRHMSVWVQWTRRVRRQRLIGSFPSDENPVYRRQLLQKYHKYFRRWKRVMFLKHWHKEQHLHRTTEPHNTSYAASIVRDKLSATLNPIADTWQPATTTNNRSRVHWRDTQDSLGATFTGVSPISPQRPLSLSSFSQTKLAASTRNNRVKNTTKVNNSNNYSDGRDAEDRPLATSYNTAKQDVSQVHPASPFTIKQLSRRPQFYDDDNDHQRTQDSYDSQEDDRDVPYLSPDPNYRSIHHPQHRTYTTEEMLSVDALAAKRRSTATMQQIVSNLANKPLEPALTLSVSNEPDVHRPLNNSRRKGIISTDNPPHTHSQTHNPAVRHVHAAAATRSSGAFPYLSQNHRHSFKHLRSNLVMILAHQHYTLSPAVVDHSVTTSRLYPTRNHRDLNLDRVVPNSKTGQLHTYAMVRSLLHWYKITRQERRHKRRLLVHQVLNAWRLHVLAQRLRREAFVHRLLMFRRHQLGRYVAWQPWRHVVHTNQLGRALVTHRQRHLVRHCVQRWVSHQAQRVVVRAKWARIPEILRLRLSLPWSVKQWYVATHQRLSVARPWITRVVFQRHWRHLLLAKRFAKYRLLCHVWRAWQEFREMRHRKTHAFKRRFHALHKIVHHEHVVKPRVALCRAWKKWVSMVSPVSKAVSRPGQRSVRHVLQSLCLSQAGQVMLFHNMRPLPVACFDTSSAVSRTAYHRPLPRLEAIRAFLWHRCVAPLEISDERHRREHQRRQRLYRRILLAQAKRDASAVDVHEKDTVADETHIHRDTQDTRSLRARMAEVLTPSTSLGRYKSELSRAKVLEEAQALLHPAWENETAEENEDEDTADWAMYTARQTQRLQTKGSPTVKWMKRQYIGLRQEDLLAAIATADQEA